MKYTLCSLNLNQATDAYGRNHIPNFVGEMMVDKNPDLIVLTEFCFCKNAKEFLEKYLVSRGYDYFPKENIYNAYNGQNMVFLAWRKNCFEPVGSIKEAAWHAYTTKGNNVPNYARIYLKDKQGIEFAFTGIRITMAMEITAGEKEEELRKQQYQEQARLRREQMEYVLQSLKGIPNVIIAGDFNNYRRGTDLVWNVNNLNCGLAFDVYTPEGQSIYGEHASSIEYEFAEDHFMATGCTVSSYQYDRSFTDKCPEVYIHGKSFCLYKDKKMIWSIPCGSGYPDHAILVGELELNDSSKSTYACSK